MTNEAHQAAVPAVEREPQTRGTAVREKILATACELFYREGARAIGVDTVVARSGVAKTSLYRWFPAKDDLIAAFLERRDTQFWAQWSRVADQHIGQPREELEEQIAWIGRYVVSKGYRGCPFINVASDFPDAEHPGRKLCASNKRKLKKRLLDLSTRIGAANPGLLADQLALLIDGAYANAQIMGKAGSARGLSPAAKALVAVALEH